MNRNVFVIFFIDVDIKMLLNTCYSKCAEEVNHRVFHLYNENISDGLNRGLNRGQTRHDWAKTKDYVLILFPLSTYN